MGLRGSQNLAVSNTCRVIPTQVMWRREWPPRYTAAVTAVGLCIPTPHFWPQPPMSSISHPSPLAPALPLGLQGLPFGWHRAFISQWEPGPRGDNWLRSADTWGMGRFSFCAKYLEIDSSAFSLDARGKIWAGNLKQRDSLQELQRGESQRAWPWSPGVDRDFRGQRLRGNKSQPFPVQSPLCFRRAVENHVPESTWRGLKKVFGRKTLQNVIKTGLGAPV